MTRNERIHKLSNAIKEYRGTFDPRTGKWIWPPKIQKRAVIVKWHRTLREPTAPSRQAAIEQVAKDAAAIDGFKTYDEFRAWIKNFDLKTPLELAAPVATIEAERSAA